jgi:hypothetical protein
MFHNRGVDLNCLRAEASAPRAVTVADNASRPRSKERIQRVRVTKGQGVLAAVQAGTFYLDRRLSAPYSRYYTSLRAGSGHADRHRTLEASNAHGVSRISPRMS